jgi:hypothetical protein
MVRHLTVTVKVFGNLPIPMTKMASLWVTWALRLRGDSGDNFSTALNFFGLMVGCRDPSVSAGVSAWMLVRGIWP